MNTCNRREFLKAGATAVVSAALGLDLRQGVLAEAAELPTEAWRKTVCRFCGTGCGVLLGVQNGSVVAVRGDRKNHNRGLLCIKGLTSFRVLNAETRARTPLIRRDGQLVEATWEEALDLIARRFQAAIEQFGPDSVGFYGSGQALTEESYVANKLFKAGIRTNHVDGNPRLCMASAVGGYLSTFGKDEPLGCYEDFDHADCFLVVGANMAECHPVLFQRLLQRKQAGAALIVIDPRRTATCVEGALHLPCRPGTDLALLNAMAQVIVAEGLIDDAFIQQHVAFHAKEDDTLALADYQTFLQDYTPDKAAAVCGVPAEQIREAARQFGQARNAMSCWTMGLNQRVRGVWVNNLVHNLHLITGKIGRPGSTPFSLTGQPNACGGVRDTGTLSHALPAGRLVANEKHRAEVEKLWGVPPGTISPKPGFPAVEMFTALGDGRLKCLLVLCTNPAQSLPNLTPYRDGMGGDSFLVVSDAFFPTETAQLADVFLPAAMWVEKEGVYGCTERRYQHIPAAVPPPGQAKPDLWILTELAKRLGHGDLIPYTSPQEVWDEWRSVARGSTYDFYGMTYPRLREAHGLLWPCPSEDHPGTKRRYVKGEDPLVPADAPTDLVFYGKPDRRAVVWLRPQEGPAEPADAEYPFYLTTGRVVHHWHTGTMTMTVPELRKFAPAAYVEIHPDDAKRLRIREGDNVRLTSRRGTLTVPAKVRPVPQPGVVFVPFFDATKLINLVTIDAVDPVSKQPEFKICAVKVEKA